MVWIGDGVWLEPELRRRLVAFARRMVGDGDAEDLAQEAIVRAGTSRAPLRREGRAEAWVFRICRHAAIDHLRARRVRRRVWMPMPADGVERGDAVADAQPADLDARSWTRLGTERLSAHQRLLVHLHYRSGHCQARLCALTGLSPAALRVRLFRARRELLKGLAAVS